MISSNNKKIYYINSNRKLSGTHSDFTYHIDIPSDSNFDSISVLQATIPKTYYLIEDDIGNNVFILRELGVDTSISVPQGNYNRRSFQTTIQTLLNSSSPNNWTYVVSFQSSTSVQNGKFTFTVSGNSGQPSLIFQTTIASQFGFDFNSTNTFSGNTLTGSNVINMQREDSIYIHCDACSNETDNILQEIFSVNNADFSNLTFQNFNVEAYVKDLISNTKNIYRFWITDEDGTPINLNGSNIQITLLLFERNNFFTMAKNFLKYTLLKN